MDNNRLSAEESLGESVHAPCFEVVRSQFFSQSYEPAVTFGRQKMWVNSVCLKKFPEVQYIQILINSITKILILRPSREEIRDALLWCSTSHEKRKPRQMACPVFFAKIYGLMDWNTDCRYRLTGKHLRENGEELLAFDLQLAKAHVYSEDTRQRCIPRLPADWHGWFGVPAAEHCAEPLVHVFHEYVTFVLERPIVETNASVDQETEREDET